MQFLFRYAHGGGDGGLLGVEEWGGTESIGLNHINRTAQPNKNVHL